MVKYFLRRIGLLVPLLVVITGLAFLLVRAAPGGPFDRERAPASAEVERQLAAKYHLDEPIWRQYGRFLGGALRGDLGPSLWYRDHTVTDIIRQALPVSLTLGLLGFLFAHGLGIPLGFYTAVKRGEWGDHVGSFVALLAICIPALVVGPLLILCFSIRWELFPAGLWVSPWHAVLPTIALGLYFAGRVSRLMREGMSGVLHAGYITAARAKGLGETRLLLRHGFRLGVLPVVSYAGPLLADLLTGSFVVESIFRIPGIGLFLVNGCLNRDYTLVVGLVLLYATLLLVLNLLVDLSYSILDPRVRYE